MFDSSFTWGPHYAHMDMIVSKTKPGLALLCHLSAYLELAGLSKMYEYFIQSCLEYGHLLYFGAAKITFTIWMLFSIELPVFVTALFHLWSHASMLQ